MTNTDPDAFPSLHRVRSTSKSKRPKLRLKETKSLGTALREST